jgi:hypothetical protein
MQISYMLLYDWLWLIVIVYIYIYIYIYISQLNNYFEILKLFPQHSSFSYKISTPFQSPVSYKMNLIEVGRVVEQNNGNIKSINGNTLHLNHLCSCINPRRNLQGMAPSICRISRTPYRASQTCISDYWFDIRPPVNVLA